MIEPHTHDEHGNVVTVEPSPAEIDAEVAESAVRADVEVEKIRADKEITLAKIASRTVEATEESRVAQLEAELRGIKDALARLVPDNGPENDVEPVSDPAPVVEVADENDGPDDLTPPETEHEAKSRPRQKSVFGMWK